jgi:hypothetical protein
MKEKGKEKGFFNLMHFGKDVADILMNGEYG